MILLFYFSGAEIAAATQSTSQRGAPHSSDTATANSDSTAYPVKPIVVTGVRAEEAEFDVPASVYVLGAEDIRLRHISRSLPEAMGNLPGFMVQKTAYGQGSPYLRGFTGFRTLFLIDGIRLNNSVFRDGPNQYWNTVDPFMIETLEAALGAQSLLYGTDAVGGVVNALPQRPHFNQGTAGGFSSRLHARLSSAERSQVGRVEVAAALTSRLSLAGGITGKAFGDLRAGGAVGRQDRTGYDEWNADITADFKVSPRSYLTVAHQRTDQDDAWRTHKTIYGISWRGTTVGFDRRYSLDQKRRLTYAKFCTVETASFLQRLTATLSLHQQAEDQNRTRSNGRMALTGFDVSTLGFSVEIETPLWVGRLIYGLDFYHDDVASYGRQYDTLGNLTGTSIQGPVADDATYRTTDFFLLTEIPVADILHFTFGSRYSYVVVDANKIALPDGSGTDNPLSRNWQKVVGSARMSVDLVPKKLMWFGGVSQSFRAPNLSDLTRLDGARSNEIEVPSTELRPETFTSVEAGVKAELSRWSLRLAVYRTAIDNLIIRTPTRDTLDGDLVVTKENSGGGYVRGIEGGVHVRVGDYAAIHCDGAWLKGRSKTYPTSERIEIEEPIDKEMRPTLRFGLNLNSIDNRTWCDLQFVTARHQSDLSTQDKSDTQRIPPGGTPGYITMSLLGGKRVGNNLVITGGVENVFDTEYRIHGSGQNEAGRNFVLGLTWQ